MLFLLNDVVLNLAPKSLTPPMPATKFAALGLTHVMRLGRELFAGEPRLTAAVDRRAEKLAMLLVAKAPQVNAALFTPPAPGCDPEEVAVRLATVDLDVLAVIKSRQDDSGPSAAVADQQVWRRRAA